MHIYGLTGGIGTGKSTVAKMLAAKGAVIVDADAVAREVVAPGSEGLAEIVRNFGPEMLNPDGALDRLKLGEVVFSDPLKRKTLEAITHPRIAMRMGEAIQKAAAEEKAVVILDIPLLFETGTMRGLVEKVILAYAPAGVQETRVLARDPLPREQVRARMASQKDIEEKRKLADIVIDNSGSLEDTQRQIDDLWPSLV
jgi:dephospho-CoA kinase